ncbi:MAG: hypothetical protein LBE78_07990 [Burkholderiaceae bacterium]|nr:hypothetical protein [Burkholderiaceae bacterium]
MSAFVPLSSLPSDLSVPGGWGGARAAETSESTAGRDTADVFGFNGLGFSQAARVLSVPSASGDGPAQLEARFLNCLFGQASSA